MQNLLSIYHYNSLTEIVEQREIMGRYGCKDIIINWDVSQSCSFTQKNITAVSNACQLLSLCLDTPNGKSK